MKAVPLLITGVFGVAFAAGLLPRLAQSRNRSAERAAANEATVVFTDSVTLDSSSSVLDLPASVAGLHEVNVYARTSGYVRELRVDIGSQVRTGDTLAVLDMPELREQERHAAAMLEQTEATARLAETSLSRWKQLGEQGAVTPQELDERSAAAGVAAANARAARANLANIRETLRFGVLTAPFSGVVTSRSIDVGSLVSAGTSASGKPLMSLVETDTVRVMLQVPQSAADRVRRGERVSVLVRDLARSANSGSGVDAGNFTGHIARTAGALDPATRTLLTEIHVPNPGRKLVPGMFATVHFDIPGTPSLRIPAVALIVRASGTQVARLENDSVRLTPVTIIRDYGTALQVEGPLKQGDLLVVNPPESLADGQRVTVAARKKAESS